MSELKAFNLPRYAGEFTMHEVYLKFEADKVIEELKDDYQDACGKLHTVGLIKDELLQKLRHQKYKRCEAMAQMCMEAHCETEADAAFFTRWEHRWLELADKFKEAK